MIQAPLAFFLRKYSTNEEMEKIFQKPWQKRLVKIIGVISRIQLFFFSIIVTVKGKKVSSKEAPIMICAPHSTFIDAWITEIMGIDYGIPDRITPVVAKELGNNPITGGALMKICHPIKVDRKDWEHL